MYLPTLPASEIIPSHQIANWLLNFIDNILNHLGLKNYETAEEVVYVVLISVISFFIGWIFQKLIVAVVKKIVQLRSGEVGKELLQQRTLQKCGYIIPPLVFLALVPFAFEGEPKILRILETAAIVYSLITLGIGLCAVMKFLFFRFNLRENTRNLPIKGILNISQGITWIVIAIVIGSVIMDKSPAALLAGLGAFAAALMLIFKDSILGFVAGIQMSQNDMLHVGDWIVVPSTPANGIVLDVSLSRVKIQNFDNTIVNVPPYTLVSTSFQNYRGMQESGARQICKNLIIDIPSVKPCTPSMLANISAKYPVMKEFIGTLQSENRTVAYNPGLRPINGTIETNLGLLRAYISLLVYNSDRYASNQQLLVRVIEASSNGIVLQIYCFTSTTDWDAYEGIQSALLEHIATVLPDFELDLYTASSMGIDLTEIPATPVPPAPQAPQTPAKAG